MSSEKISRSELIGLFMNKKCRIINVSYDTDARVRKTGNPHPLVSKSVTLNGVTNYQYDKALEKRTAEAGLNPAESRSLHDRTWGTRVGDTPIIEHKGKSYLDVMVNNVIESAYKDSQSGKELSYEDVKDYLPNKSNSLVKVANISIDNISMVKVDGVEYEVT